MHGYRLPPALGLLRALPCALGKQHPAGDTLPAVLLLGLHPAHLSPSCLRRPAPPPMPMEDPFSGRRCHLAVGYPHELPVPLQPHFLQLHWSTV